MTTHKREEGKDVQREGEGEVESRRGGKFDARWGDRPSFGIKTKARPSNWIMDPVYCQIDFGQKNLTST